ncbi:MAG: GxxExxY protein [Armatimonadetes bacterium]|nr:GxxExxY protein [Armatimonadota bacterium]
MKPQSAQRQNNNFFSKEKEISLCPQKEFPLKDITGRIISCAIEVHSKLGPGLLENIYEEALAYEFKLRGVMYDRQKEIILNYKGENVGTYRIDYLVEREVIVELKTVEAINKIHEAQLLTYLRAMNKRIGLLINFNVEKLKDGIKRLII